MEVKNSDYPARNTRKLKKPKDDIKEDEITLTSTPRRKTNSKKNSKISLPCSPKTPTSPKTPKKNKPIKGLKLPDWEVQDIRGFLNETGESVQSSPKGD